jgi:ribonuclease T
MSKKDIYISVDIETSGPVPELYSLLTIGACHVYKPEISFECNIKPISRNFDPAALQVTGLSLDKLEAEGLTPQEAMKNFRLWIENLAEPDSNLVFVGFNAAFDWSFVNYYFHKYLGENPFGFSALDIKSMYLGATNCNWYETRSSKMAEKLNPTLIGDHNALHDARYQAELFRLLKDLN